MRRALAAIALALGLVAACFPALEGAPCQSDLNCPLAQTCSTEGRCVARCTLACDPGMVCGQRGGAPACECAPYEGDELHVDAREGAAVGSAPFPTGAAAPVACRFDTVSGALGAAQLDPARPRTVVLVGDGTLREYPKEAFPLTLRPGLRIESRPSAATEHVLLVPPRQGAPVGGEPEAAVWLGGGASAAGFTVRRSGAAGGAGVTARCDPAGARSVSQLRVEGSFATGVEARGCGLILEEVVIDGAQVGLRVEAPAAEPVALARSAILSADAGVLATSGAVLLDQVEIARFGAQGIFVRPQQGSVVLTLDGGSIHDGQGNALTTFRTLNTDPGTVQVTARGAELFANGGSGVLHQAGQLSIEGGRIATHQGAAAFGLSASGGSEATLSGTVLEGNRVNLRAFDGAQVTGTGVAIRDAQLTGVDVGGAAPSTPETVVTLTDSAISGSGARGLRVEHARAVLRGASKVESSAAMGLSCANATVALDAVEAARPRVSQNVGGALELEDCAFSSVGAILESNQAASATNATLFVADPSSSPGKPFSLRDCEVSGDASGGILLAVTTKPALAGGGRSVVVEGCSFTGGERGISIGGLVAGTFSSNTITGASKTGLVVNTTGGSGSALSLLDNVVTGNTTPSTASDAAGGIRLEGPALAANDFLFRGNQVFKNQRAQVTVTGSGTWELGGGTCLTRNVISCYASGWPGLIVDTAALDASNNSWTSHPPQADDIVGNPRDYRRIDLLIPAPATNVSTSCDPAAVPCP